MVNYDRADIFTLIKLLTDIDAPRFESWDTVGEDWEFVHQRYSFFEIGRHGSFREKVIYFYTSREFQKDE